VVDPTTKEEIERFLRTLMQPAPGAPFVPGSTPIPLAVPSFGWEEVASALESLVSFDVTMGEKVAAFERDFADYLGVRYAVMVNSGSSANLLALSILTSPLLPGHFEKGAEVITPAVTWATTVFPIIQTGLVPVLVDVELDTFDIDITKIEQAITPRTRAILPVHLLGNPCDMPGIMDLAERYGLTVMEDACESHGAEVGGKKTGSWGRVGTFSFYYSHHITTIEGGMVVTDDREIAEMARGLRAFGWIRDLENYEDLAVLHGEIDPRFLFINMGFNMRPTELQGAFGQKQIPKLDTYIEARRDNSNYWNEALADYKDWLYLHNERPGTRHAWFGFPITVLPGAPFSRDDLTGFLEAQGVETRPIMAGNIAEQPVLQHFPYRVSGSLEQAQLIMRNSFLIGNHQGIGSDERDAVVGYLCEFMTGKGVGAALP
jgi:CDP-6-deoxy-D-xylo-4-hexulose-3-dehydrase